MGDRPGFGSTTQSSPLGLEFNWRSAAGDRQPVQPERPIVADRTGNPGNSRVLELSYNDREFDRKLAAGNYDTLRIKDLPPGVKISSWVDDKGFFFWYRDGNDNRRPHYIPGDVKTIEVAGFSQNVDEMRLNATMAHLREADQSRVGFTAVNGRTSPLEFAQRMGNLGQQELDNQERWLRTAAAGSPNNPYFRIYLSDILLAQAFRPIMDQLNSGRDRIDLNTPYTQAKLQQAIAEAQRAQQITRGQSGLRYPNVDMAPALHPFGLNPYAYNPDMYWGGALYQSYQREVGLKALQFYIQRFSSVELPPIMPPR